MIVSIHQPQYLPWLGYFDKMAGCDHFVLLDDVQFKKNEWQNRNRIRTPEGWQWITVPVLHDHGQKINETRLNDQMNWPKKHLTALQINYGRSKFFDWVMEKLGDLYSRKWNDLSSVNIESVKILKDLLGITTPLALSSDLEVSPEKTQRLIDICRHFGADAYLSGPDGSKYMDIAKFTASNINIITQEYAHPVYAQLWDGTRPGGFMAYLSALDLLFNHGPDSLQILKEGKSK